jgi:TrmH family RNA methyltransferase
MLSKNQEKLIISLHNKKGRESSGLCLVEGKKNLEMACEFLDFSFTESDSENFKKLITTETPQDIAGVAKIPKFSLNDLDSKKLIIALDNVQDPGNIGTILRLCLGFEAGLILIDCADPSNSKVIRSSAGAFFKTPWIKMKEEDFLAYANNLNDFEKYRLELKEDGLKLNKKSKLGDRVLILGGSEGQGIRIKNNWPSLSIEHNNNLESLNIASALSIVIWSIYSS